MLIQNELVTSRETNERISCQQKCWLFTWKLQFHKNYNLLFVSLIASHWRLHSAGSMAPTEEHLHLNSKCETLNSSPILPKRKKGEECSPKVDCGYSAPSSYSLCSLTDEVRDFLCHTLLPWHAASLRPKITKPTNPRLEPLKLWAQTNLLSF